MNLKSRETTIGHIILGVMLFAVFFVLSKRIESIKELQFPVEQNQKTIILQEEQLNKLYQRIELHEAAISNQVLKETLKTTIVAKAIAPIAKNKLSLKHKRDIADAIIYHAHKYNVSVSLLLALIRTESAFNPHAVSYAGAQGLGQLMPYTAEDIRAALHQNRYRWPDINQNIQYSAYYLAKMIDVFDGSEDNAIRAYNGGPHRVSEYLAYGKCKEKAGINCGEIVELRQQTIDYLEKVKGFQKKYQLMGIN